MLNHVAFDGDAILSCGSSHTVDLTSKPDIVQETGCVGDAVLDWVYPGGSFTLDTCFPESESRCVLSRKFSPISWSPIFQVFNFAQILSSCICPTLLGAKYKALEKENEYTMFRDSRMHLSGWISTSLVDEIYCCSISYIYFVEFFHIEIDPDAN